MMENDGTEAIVKKERSEMKKKSGDDGNSGMKKSGSASIGPKLEPNDQSDGSGNGIEERRRVEAKKEQGETTKPSGQNEPGTATAASNEMLTDVKPQLANQIGASAMNGTKAIVKKESGNASVSQNQSSAIGIITIESSDEESLDGEGSNSAEKSTPKGQQRRQRARDRNRSSASGRNPVLAPTTATSNGISTSGEKPKAYDRNCASAMVENDATEANVKKEPSEMKKSGDDDRKRETEEPGGGSTEPSDQSDGSTSGIEERRCSEAKKQQGVTSTVPKRKPGDQLERSAIDGNLEPKKEEPVTPLDQNGSASSTRPSNGTSMGKKRKWDEQNGGASASGGSDTNDKKRRSGRNVRLDHVRESQNQSSAMDNVNVESDEESLDGQGSISSQKSTRSEQRHQLAKELGRKYVNAERKIRCRNCSSFIVVASHFRNINVGQIMDHLFTHLKKPIFKCNQCSPLRFTNQMAAYRHATAVHEGRFKEVIDDETDKFHDEIMILLKECFDEEQD